LAFRGRLLAEDVGLAIEVNVNLPELEKRFTISHEISHFIVEGGELTDVPHRCLRAKVRGRRQAEIERLCDELADEILVPEEWLIKELDRPRVNLKNVVGIAMKARASMDCTLRRIVDLGLWNGRFVWWVARSGALMAARSWPAAEKDFLARVRVAPSGESLLEKAADDETVHEGVETILVNDEAVEYRIQCLRVSGDTDLEAGVLSVLVFA
jgi:Zn-dependent peptidase ImmA (M78 family)